ncbi:hypothetical protein EOD41_09855 [Mucilaginibacter limnophilus]|uniref:Lipopolysaccharide heptosyltransferase family protein n=1 Tax=Mucilaginibacter limnophilus TaxID=1932778 RepID=A0A3S2Y397_9SPHI|nr:hypothetical protein [Mucilaginibacter limnophilus]RVU00928.1 hypothetical protein EOD41_09855 [Mucilaginibacter limnophilus]
MSAVYLPIRSFGDFIITASVLKQHAFEKVPVIIPQYLKNIYNAIHADDYFDITGEISFTDQPAFFEMYKVRDMANLRRLIRDLMTTIRSLSKANTYLLDYSSNRMLYTGAKLRWPSKSENIYQAKHELLLQYFDLKSYRPVAEFTPLNSGQKRILILPDSRIPSKRINEKLIELIINEFSNHKVHQALFTKNALPENVLAYNSFEQLLQLIADHDLVISAESLPYHLANFCNKPHFVVYNNSRHFKSTFMTPFMQQNSFYAFFEQNNYKTVLNKLNEILF